VLQITQDNSGPAIGEVDTLSLFKGGQDVNKFQETQYKILTSRGVAARVIEALNLQDTPEFKAIAAKYPKAPPEKLRSYMIDLFLDKLVVNPVKDTYLVEVAFKSQDRALAKKVTDALAREYMQLVIDSRAQSFTLVKDWLGKQLAQMTQKVQASQKKLFEFGQKHDFYALEDKDNVIIQKYIELSALLTKAEFGRHGHRCLHFCGERTSGGLLPGRGLFSHQGSGYLLWQRPFPFLGGGWPVPGRAPGPARGPGLV